ncbi:MAG: hypothetical protein ACE5FM_01050 [Methyloligellaceae bacterium]
MYRVVVDHYHAALTRLRRIHGPVDNFIYEFNPKWIVKVDNTIALWQREFQRVTAYRLHIGAI